MEYVVSLLGRNSPRSMSLLIADFARWFRQRRVAVLSQACLPAVVLAGDERLVTGSTINQSQLLVWNLKTLQLIKRCDFPNLRICEAWTLNAGAFLVFYDLLPLVVDVDTETVTQLPIATLWRPIV